MKKLLFIALCMLAGVAFADATNDAFNEGASFGKGHVSQGTGSLNNPGTVTGSIPGYTTNPPESGYYGGVQGGDGGIGNKGQTAIGSNDAGQAIISSGTTNPVPTIDPNAPFIEYGKNTEGSAGSIMDGSGQQCTETSVSKTTFENYTCDRDVAVIQTCTRTASIVVTGSTETQNTTLELNAQAGSLTLEADYWLRYDFVMQESGVISPGTVNFSYPSQPGYHGGRLDYSVSFRSASVRINFNQSQAMNFAPFAVSKGDTVSLRIRSNTDGHYATYRDSLVNNIQAAGYIVKLTVPFAVQRDTTKSSLQWNESCNFDKSQSTGLKETTCVDPGEDRSVTQSGITFTEHSDCWQYSDAYATATNSTGNCSALMNDRNCTRATTACTEMESGVCVHQSESWQCQKTYTSGGLLCGGDYYCKTGDCNDANGAGDNGFDEAVAKLAGLASAGDEVASSQDQVNVKAFTGNTMRCHKAFAGFSNCCKDSGWGQDVGLSHCNSDEMALGKAKAKKVTVRVGERCDHKVLGVCVQKSQVYCVFQGKLARIIQEQGRRDQLGVSFGSGDNPDCRGITVPELQNINFDRINFSDFYDDLMNNQKIPDTDAMVKQVKDRIAAQVNQQGGPK